MYNSQVTYMKNHLLAQARSLANQYKALQSFISEHQDAINKSAAGDYDFKFLDPASVGKSVAKIFSKRGDYELKQTRRDYRSAADSPDETELLILSSFETDKTKNEFFTFQKINGKEYFRYMIPLTMDSSCLPCHGEPKGQVDVSGHIKEGYKLGDIGGLISISLPVEKDKRHVLNNMIRNASFISILAIILFIALYYLFKRMVNLAMELRIKHRALAKMNRELKEMNRIKNEFFSIASHDLRSPFVAISGLLDLLSLEEKDHPLSERQKDILNRITQATQTLLFLINNLLDFTKIESGTAGIITDRASLLEIIERSWGLLHVLAQNKKINVHIDVPDSIILEVDGPKIEQVINNLLNNAIKYTPDGGQIFINAIKKEDEAEISIRDTGVGIDRNDLRRIFVSYIQVRSAGTRGEKGTGLGLAICKKFIELHGGRIWATSEVGKGTTVSFTLPLAPARTKLENV